MYCTGVRRGMTMATGNMYREFSVEFGHVDFEALSHSAYFRHTDKLTAANFALVLRAK